LAASWLARVTKSVPGLGIISRQAPKQISSSACGSAFRLAVLNGSD